MTMTECASCADERAAGAAFCESCGRALSAGPPCPHCGTRGSVAADGYCENCGLLAARERDHQETDAGALAAAATDRGRRHHRNEDAMWLAARHPTDRHPTARHPTDRHPTDPDPAGWHGEVDVVVCDGVSSSFDPDVASETAAVTAGEALAADPDVEAAILAAKEAVAALASSGDPRRAVSNPACTIVAAAVRGPHVTFGWLGDSRAYWLPAAGPAEQLTEDDSWVTHVIALGADPQVAMQDPKAHAITAWLGADAGTVGPRTGAFTATAPGHLVLCSDGLWNYLTDPANFGAAVRACLHEEGTLIGAARALCDLANEAGGADNITVALVPVRPATPDDARHPR